MKALIFCVPLLVYGQAATDVEQGRALFRSNCAFCHGATARGGRGPNLVSAPLTHGDSSENIEAVIREGVPGTSMPSFGSFSPEELRQVAIYLKSLSAGQRRAVHVPGDAAKGREVYAANGCAGCHRIGNEGSVFGPDLSRVGAARSVDYIRQSIIEPSADIPDEYRGVMVVTNDGHRVTGVRVNEDTFTVQLRDVSQNFRMFEKDRVKEVSEVNHSLMPAYKQLSPAQLDDLVAYLVTLRGPSAKTDHVNKARTIK